MYLQPKITDFASILIKDILLSRYFNLKLEIAQKYFKLLKVVFKIFCLFLLDANSSLRSAKNEAICAIMWTSINFTSDSKVFCIALTFCYTKNTLIHELKVSECILARIECNS